jgi:hypothetical protein
MEEQPQKAIGIIVPFIENKQAKQRHCHSRAKTPSKRA